MDERKGELLKAARQVIELFYQGESFWLSQYYEEGMECITPHFKKENRNQKEISSYLKVLSRTVCGIIHKDYKVVLQTNIAAIITGSYYAVVMQESGKAIQELLDSTIVFKTDTAGMKVRHIHISSGAAEEKQYCIKDISERLFFLKEEEIFYLESQHNHVIWHCLNGRMETTGSLKEAEEMLSEVFYRIQRGFIINTNHAYKVDRCYVQMDNGEKLQIPVKKYCDVKKGLMKDEK